MNKFIKPVLVLSVFIICGILYSCNDNDLESIKGADIIEDFSDAEPVENTSLAVIFVYICGEISEAGVYELSDGSRLFELIELAGGVTENARLDGMNLAELLYDSQMVNIPSVEDSYEQADGGLVDINSASVSELTALPGIGEARAEAIVSYRKKNGRFMSAEDIMMVPGIKESLYDNIKDLITVR